MTSKSVYLSGFGNEHSTEALPGALPQGQFSPQQCPYGLYTEKFSSTAFTAPRASNARTWFYRIRPSVVHGAFRRLQDKFLITAPLIDTVTPPDQLRWNPRAIPERPTDFVDSLFTVAVNGDAKAQIGMGIHLYAANKSMEERFFYNADGELLLIPQEGGLLLHTECGLLDVVPGEIALIPRGLKFRVELSEATARGYVCENYGERFTLPERGPVGSDGFANDRDFLAPTAAYEDRQDDFELLVKFQGCLYGCELGHSPLDVVAWTGNSYPFKYDLQLFNTMGSVSYDHPDPSIYTVLTSPSGTAGVANIDFVIFPERWMVAENTFRPPWYHRNIMNEYMGLIRGVYDAKESGFLPGGGSLHNCMSPHGPDTDSFAKASGVSLKPDRYQDTLAFMLESRYVIEPTQHALDWEYLQDSYRDCWQGLDSHFTGKADV